MRVIAVTEQGWRFDVLIDRVHVDYHFTNVMLRQRLPFVPSTQDCTSRVLGERLRSRLGTGGFGPHSKQYLVIMTITTPLLSLHSTHPISFQSTGCFRRLRKSQYHPSVPRNMLRFALSHLLTGSMPNIDGKSPLLTWMYLGITGQLGPGLACRRRGFQPHHVRPQCYVDTSYLCQTTLPYLTTRGQVPVPYCLLL